MLSRAGNQSPEGSPIRTELREVCEIAQNTLENVRSLSQALHPVMLDESVLESTLDWYIPMVVRHTGIALSYKKIGAQFQVNGYSAVHVYHVVQTAYNKVE